MDVHDSDANNSDDDIHMIKVANADKSIEDKEILNSESDEDQNIFNDGIEILEEEIFLMSRYYRDISDASVIRSIS